LFSGRGKENEGWKGRGRDGFLRVESPMRTRESSTGIEKFASILKMVMKESSPSSFLPRFGSVVYLSLDSAGFFLGR